MTVVGVIVDMTIIAVETVTDVTMVAMITIVVIVMMTVRVVRKVTKSTTKKEKENLLVPPFISIFFSISSYFPPNDVPFKCNPIISIYFSTKYNQHLAFSQKIELSKDNISQSFDNP
jgi:hypothetical protein